MERTLTPWQKTQLVFQVEHEAATAAIAAKVARVLVAGDLLRLTGDLGAGKSTFTRHLLHALGHGGDVPSPTYTLVQVYDTTTRLPVAHVDAYRLQSPEELDTLDLTPFAQHGVMVVEWPEKAGALAQGPRELIPYHIQSIDNPGTLTIHFENGTAEGSRTLTLIGSPSWQRRFALIDDRARRPVTDQGRLDFLGSLGLTGYHVAGRAGDWSGRSYARITLQDKTTAMLMDSPPPQEGVTAYAQVADYYRSLGLTAATTHGMDVQNGYLLTSDFGDTQLLSLVEQNHPTTPQWYDVAVDVLVHLCRSQPMPSALTMGPTDWLVALSRFTDWYLPWATGHATAPATRAAFMAQWQALFPIVAALPQGTLPKDFQATNMMILGTEPSIENMGLIDIQDAQTQSIALDLAILVRDIRRSQNDDLEHRALARAAQALNLPLPQLTTAFNIANLHHSIRILGGLARAGVRDDKWTGAHRFMARTWQVAQQSFATPALASMVPQLQLLMQQGLARLAAQQTTTSQAA